jgi:hypothetical protein
MAYYKDQIQNVINQIGQDLNDEKIDFQYSQKIIKYLVKAKECCYISGAGDKIFDTTNEAAE